MDNSSNNDESVSSESMMIDSCISNIKSKKIKGISEFSLRKDSKILKEEDQSQFCSIHNLQLMYFCETCKKPICSDCAMLSKNHKNHEFQSINNIYQQHLSKIQEESLLLQAKIRYLNQLVINLDEQIEQVNSNKEERQQELIVFIEQVQQKLDLTHKSKLC